MPGPTRWDLLPAAHAAEGLSLDLAGGIDWAVLAPREGQVPVEALGELVLVGPAVADWQAANLVPLLAVAGAIPRAWPRCSHGSRSGARRWSGPG